ncbi:hypothetical protein EIL82_13885 [Pandoraea apista]|uniref:NADPH-dependent 7-cyano-7-deazaguanine reductase N-terminal domain-containing protein n=1 Tax=Pandoraea apista TaxID=93218 RepID=A0ABX9ZRJ2_9BURK|nr:hypothetical protein C7830_07210 [Pandoraea apista]RRJ27868.1 hypothetical protein EIB05_20455 [Pandoraea apista]RRJ79505.1 hypothetical protein EIL82_13885 [Pandoraea apista]RSD15280.1 hypothetical protein EJB12_07625 [Pandoraea apista]RSD22496.1 hypothetical protein EIZ52_06530 [Pandoraea apista]
MVIIGHRGTLQHLAAARGYDLWNHYEVAWLDIHHRPQIAAVKLVIPCDSPICWRCRTRIATSSRCVPRPSTRPTPLKPMWRVSYRAACRPTILYARHP